MNPKRLFEPNESVVLIQGVTLADIENIVRKAVKDQFDVFRDEIQPRSPAKIKRKEAAERLGVTLPTLDNYGKHGILHPQHIGGRVFYLENEIKNYEQNKKKRL